MNESKTRKGVGRAGRKTRKQEILERLAVVCNLDSVARNIFSDLETGVDLVVEAGIGEKMYGIAERVGLQLAKPGALACLDGEGKEAEKEAHASSRQWIDAHCSELSIFDLDRMALANWQVIHALQTHLATHLIMAESLRDRAAFIRDQAARDVETVTGNPAVFMNRLIGAGVVHNDFHNMSRDRLARVVAAIKGQDLASALASVSEVPGVEILQEKRDVAPATTPELRSVSEPETIQSSVADTGIFELQVSEDLLSEASDQSDDGAFNGEDEALPFDQKSGADDALMTEHQSLSEIENSKEAAPISGATLSSEDGESLVKDKEENQPAMWENAIDHLDFGDLPFAVTAREAVSVDEKAALNFKLPPASIRTWRDLIGEDEERKKYAASFEEGGQFVWFQRLMIAWSREHNIQIESFDYINWYVMLAVVPEKKVDPAIEVLIHGTLFAERRGSSSVVQIICTDPSAKQMEPAFPLG